MMAQILFCLMLATVPSEDPRDAKIRELEATIALLQARIEKQQEEIDRLKRGSPEEPEKCRACNATGLMRCPKCRGSGKGKCPKCGGSGLMRCPYCKGAWGVKCGYCNGTGTVVTGTKQIGMFVHKTYGTCTYCNGTGWFHEVWSGKARRGRTSGQCPHCSDQPKRKRGWIRCDECLGTGEKGKCPLCNGKKGVPCKLCGGDGIRGNEEPTTQPANSAPAGRKAP